LIEAATNNHLWADNFDGELVNVFDLQDQVTVSVGRPNLSGLKSSGRGK
jgi:TolB-like protein